MNFFPRDPADCCCGATVPAFCHDFNVNIDCSAVRCPAAPKEEDPASGVVLVGVGCRDVCSCCGGFELGQAIPEWCDVIKMPHWKRCKLLGCPARRGKK